jgi:hypothetical protein
MKLFASILLFLVFTANADTPPPGIVKLKGGTDGTTIGNVGDAIKTTGSSTVSGSVSITNFPATQPISAVSLPLPSNAAQEVGGHLDSIDSKLTAPLAVTGTFFQSVQPVSQSGSWTVLQGTSPWVTSRNWNLTFAGDKVDASGSSVSVSNFPAIQPVSGTVAVSNAFALDSTLLALSAKFGSLGQKTMSGSSPVVIASDQSTLSTNATLQTGSAIVGKVGIDQTTPGNTNGVVVNSSALPTGAALASNQTSGAQSTTINDPITGIKTQVTIASQLQTTIDPTEVFNESFEGGSLDTTNRWNTPTVAGAGSVTQSGSLGAIISVGTGANSAAALISQATFPTQYGSPITLAWGQKIETTTIATGNYRFMGYGNAGTSYSTSNPISNGIGFEITTAGVLRAVIYASDVLIFSQNITIPTDGLEHIFAIQNRGNFTIWYLDNFTFPTVTAQLQSPDATLLPLRFASLNGGSTTVGTPTMDIFAIAMLDAGRNASQISDGTFPWRRTQVSAIGALSTGNSYLNGTATSSAINTAVIPATDASQYQCLKFQVTGTSTQTLTMQGSGDNSTWLSVPIKDVSAFTSAVQTTVVNTGGESTFYHPILTRYVRLFSTAYTSGTMTVNYQFSTLPCSVDIGSKANTAQGTTATTMSSGTLTTQATSTDISSAARTTTFTSAAINPSQGSQSLSTAISVTAVSGTNPTMDCVLQQSSDTGTTFYDVYHWERITATGVYQSNSIRNNGNRIRYVCTIAGTSPSFTFSGIRIDSQNRGQNTHRFFDRNLNANTGNSTSATWYTEDCDTYQIFTNFASCTVQPTLVLDISEDNSNFAASALTLNPTANTITVSAAQSVMGKFSRLRTSVAGTGCTDNYVALRCIGK